MTSPIWGSKPSTPYVDPLCHVLHAVCLSDLLIQGPPPPASPWTLLPDESQGNQAIALALDKQLIEGFV